MLDFVELKKISLPRKASILIQIKNASKFSVMYQFEKMLGDLKLVLGISQSFLSP